MLLNFIFATDISEVSQSLFDHFSISHLRMGIGFFLALALISTGRRFFNNTWNIPNWHWWAYLVGTLIFGIAWELVENTILLPLKFNSTPDSLQNSITDVILVTGAALGIFFLGKHIYSISNLTSHQQFVWFYFYSFLPYICLEFVFYLCEFLVLG